MSRGKEVCVQQCSKVALIGLAALLTWWVHGQLSDGSWLHLLRVLVEVAARH